MTPPRPAPKQGTFTNGLPDPFDNRDSSNAQRNAVKPLEYRSPDGSVVTAADCR